MGCVMHEKANALGSRCAIRLALAGVTAALLAGCSSDVTRFSDNPFSNPFQSAAADPDKTPVGAVQPSGTYATSQASAGAIESHPLTPPAPVARYAAPSTPNPQLAAQNGANHPDAEIHTGSTSAWSAAGGAPIVVADGETAGLIAVRYGVPIDALLHANGMASASDVRPGTRLVIPVYNAGGASAHPQRSAQAAPHPVGKDKILPTRANPAEHVVQGAPAGHNLHFVTGPQPVKNAPGKAIAGKNAKDGKAVGKADMAKPLKNARLDKQAAMDSKADHKPAAVDTTETGSLPPAAAPLVASAPAAIAPAAPSAAAAPEFRWPAHGRIIQAFKSGGNDGINIAVPEGTAVKAADDGIVAYAGDELKGYGKLVLIRHANGFVSAYANNGEIDVKRGDTVKRGQVIAKSGQSGNVASPQLHFELRKGSTPVDPTQYLAGL
jgi:murein DD-endopeptidase MepM/ murein hydrolase activator NlpD